MELRLSGAPQAVFEDRRGAKLSVVVVRGGPCLLMLRQPASVSRVGLEMDERAVMQYAICSAVHSFGRYGAIRGGIAK